MCIAVGPLIGRHCGTKIPSEIQSSTGILSLSFHTDMAVAKDGFSARYNMTLKEVNDSKCFVCFFSVGLATNLKMWFASNKEVAKYIEAV